jgi:DNA-binding beta-propeller fold protein YncE/TolB-like protein
VLCGGQEPEKDLDFFPWLPNNQVALQALKATCSAGGRWVKRSVLLLAAVTCLLFINWPALSLGAAISMEPERMRIAIVDFDTMGGDFKVTDLGSIVAEWLITSFVQSGRFEVVERSQLQKILEEQKLAVTGLVAQDTAVKLGKVLGVKVIISGTLIKIGEAIEINSRLIDTQDGAIIKAEKRRAERFAELERAVEDLATQIKGDFPLVGYVVNVSPQEVMIDLGWKHGASANQTFIVFREGKQIVHPTTNQVLAVEEIPLGEIRITKVDRITSTGTLIKQNEGQRIQSGDRVRTPTSAVTMTASKPVEPSPIPAPGESKPVLPEVGKAQRPQFLFKWGEEGRDPGKFAAPLSLCLDKNDQIYVTDSENHRVQVFDRQGRLLRTIGRRGRGNGEFSIPTDVAVDEEGCLYVVDSRNRRVQKFDPNGNFLLQFGSSGRRGDAIQFAIPTGIAVGRGGSVYVADAKLGRIQCFDRLGNLLLSFGERGRGPGTLSRPTYLATDRDGNLYVVDSGTARIQKYDPRGNYLASIERKGRRDSDFVLPQGIAISPSGHLYIVDGETGRLIIADGNGNRLFAFGERGRGEGKINNPVDVALDREGNIYILEREAARIQKFSPFSL